jgi:Fe2+ transport system protein FeoA
LDVEIIIVEIIMIVTQSKHLPLCPSSSATLDGKNCKETGTVLKLSDADRGAYTIKVVASREPETFNRLCSLGLIPGFKMKVLRKISKGPIIIEMKDTQIALGREVAESLLISSREEDAQPKMHC